MQQAFTVHIFKRIATIEHIWTSEDVLLVKTVILPFPPYKGLTIEDERGTDLELDAPIFSLVQMSFRVFTDPDVEIINARKAGRDGRSTEDIIHEYEQEGWHRHGREEKTINE